MSMPEGAYTKIMTSIGGLVRNAYNRGYEAGIDDSQKKISKDIAESVGQAIGQALRDSGEEYISVETYEIEINKQKDIVASKTAENADLRQRIMALEDHIKSLYKIIDRKDLPYDAFGDYGHDNDRGFVADEWYRENFKNDETDEIQEAAD